MKQNIIHIGLDVDDTQYHGAAFNKETGEVIEFKSRPTLKGLLQQLDRDLLRSRQKVMRQRNQLRKHLQSVLRRSGLHYKAETGNKSHWTRHHYCWLERTIDVFRQLPLLQRQDIQSAGSSLMSRAIPDNHGAYFEVKSSGSTGRPICVLGTDMTMMYVSALTMRGHIWHQRDGRQKNVDIRTIKSSAMLQKPAVWMAIPDAGKSIRLDINNPIDKLFDQLIVEDPVYMQTHPYTLKGLIECSVSRGMQPKNLREVRTFGEAMESGIRALARQHWGVDVIDSYSAMEIGPIAIQCPKSENLHVQSESVLLEILRDDGTPCQPGEVGRVVITAMHNFATPLIRYEIGDYAEVGDSCSCGRGLPVLTRILGRQRNFLVLPSGEKRFPEAWRTFSEIAPEIRQFQLIQKSLERIEINLVVSAPLSAEKEHQLMHYMNGKFKNQFMYDFVYLDHIPRAANGKFEEFKSELV